MMCADCRTRHAFEDGYTARACACECHAEPCVVCGAPVVAGEPGGHDAGCFLYSGELTTAELRDLRIVRDRALADAGDIAPMMRVSYSARPTGGKAGAAFTTSRTVIPWIEALNMEVH